MSSPDIGLETLLELDGSVLEQEGGFWIKSDKGVPYAFESAHRLLEDFFSEVDRVIKEAQE